MGGLESVPVRFDAGGPVGPTGNTRAVLSELAALASRLASSGESGAIDVRALPLSPADRDWLRETLGRGEVRAEIDAAGSSSIEETAFPGLWWVTHRNANGQPVAELIEVATVPAIIAAEPSEAAASAARLAAIAAEGAESARASRA